MKTKINILLIAFTTLFISACSTSVERLDAEQQVDLSGAWNDTDSQLVAKEMIADSLSRPWLTNFMKEEGDSPALIVGKVRNLSHEHINTNTFIADMERELINSGNVQFVASAETREEIRDERVDQDFNASEATRKEIGQEYGADFMMQGQINTIIDIDGKTQVRYYQVNLELVSLTDNRKVWIGQKKIKKLVKNSKLRN